MKVLHEIIGVAGRRDIQKLKLGEETHELLTPILNRQESRDGH